MDHKLPNDLAISTMPREPRHDVVIVTCKVCGQRFNLNNLTEAYHHDLDPHEPLPSSKR